MKDKSPKYRFLITDTSKPFENKAGTILELMGFEVEYNRMFGDFKVDVFCKKKKNIGSGYDLLVCLIDNGKRKVVKDAIERLNHTREIVKEQLLKEFPFSYFKAVFISAAGFTNDAVKAAKKYQAALKTLELLIEDLEEFIKITKKLIRQSELADVESDEDIEQSFFLQTPDEK